jgi:hypothetical protein
MLNIKSNLIRHYKTKLKEAQNKPQSSPSYKRNISKINDKLDRIRLGDYQPTKTDLKEVKKLTTNTRTRDKIDKAVKSIDTDGESFYIWNSADRKSPYAGGGIDLACTVKFRTDEGDYMYRHYGIVSNRLDGAVTDRMINEQILYGSKMMDNAYAVETGSGVTLHIVSFQVIWAGRE